MGQELSVQSALYDNTLVNKLRNECKNGNVKYISQFISKSEDDLSINWRKMADIAFSNGHTEVIQCIKNSGKLTRYDLLWLTCKYGYSPFGDVERTTMAFTYQYAGEVENIDWEELKNTTNLDPFTINFQRSG